MILFDKKDNWPMYLSNLDKVFLIGPTYYQSFISYEHIENDVFWVIFTRKNKILCYLLLLSSVDSKFVIDFIAAG